MSPLNWNVVLLGLLFVSGVFSAEVDFPLADDSEINQKNTCAITQVLQAMNELLSELSAEIRDLKKQVQTTCKGGKEGRRPPSGIRGNVDEDDDDDMFGSEFDIFKEPDDKTKEESETSVPVPDPGDEDDVFDFDGDTETPADDLINGISKWWDTILPFAPKPEESTTTTTSTPAPPFFPAYPNYDDRTEYNGKTDDNDFSSPWFGEDTSTTGPPLSNILPPEPYSCPEPFRLQAGGCYLIFQDQREWRSWGDAHAFCQGYGGSLASPWRLRELQEFLSRYYSDAFWVGASLDTSARSWKWLSGRQMESSAWKRGQPNRNPGMKCVFLDKWSGYMANNFFCGSKYPFICDFREV